MEYSWFQYEFSVDMAQRTLNVEEGTKTSSSDARRVRNGPIEGVLIVV